MEDRNKNICKLIEVGQVQTALEQALEIRSLVELSEMIHNNKTDYKVRINDLKGWFPKGSKVIEKRLDYYNQFSDLLVTELTK